VVKGDAVTRRQILAYSALLVPLAAAPWWIGGTGSIYGVSALVLSALFFALAIPVGFRRTGEGDKMKPEKRLFGYSVLYLFVLFAALVVDRVAASQGWIA
jgi:protoheme IX farnesyltransferase